MGRRRRRVVVHFDYLKPCALGTRLDSPTADNAPYQLPQPPYPSTLPTTPTHHHLELLDDDEGPGPLQPTPPPTRTLITLPPPAPRYPKWSRAPPPRYGEVVTHKKNLRRILCGGEQCCGLGLGTWCVCTGLCTIFVKQLHVHVCGVYLY